MICALASGYVLSVLSVLVWLAFFHGATKEGPRG